MFYAISKHFLNNSIYIELLVLRNKNNYCYKYSVFVTIYLYTFKFFHLNHICL